MLVAQSEVSFVSVRPLFYLVYIGPGVRYLVLTKLGTFVDIMIYNQF